MNDTRPPSRQRRDRNQDSNQRTRKKRRRKGAKQRDRSANPRAAAPARRGRTRKGRQGGKPDRGPRHHREAASGPPGPAEGILELVPEGYGVLRQVTESFQPTPEDCHVSQSLIRRYGLLAGCSVRGMSAVRNGRRQLDSIESVEGDDPEKFRQRTPYTKMISIDPEEPLLIAEGNDPDMRILDLVTPIGKGQRGLIVAPPRTGKTVLLRKLANSIAESHPEVHLFMLLIDERPEEVTEMRRETKAQVVHSSNDHSAKRHIGTVEMILERARRMVEGGADVVILLDSLTRVARSYNTATKGSGRTLSGGLDVRTMAKPREFFGAARNLEDGGSLTIIATALIDTGSRMDDVIFEEFKGTGNMELYLHRGLADRRIWPAIHIQKSGTRKEEKLRSAEDQRRINLLRRALAGTAPEESLQALLAKIEQTASNRQFLEMIK